MRTCWEEKPSNRPTFSEIHEYLCKLLANTQPSIYSDYRRVYTSQISESYVEDSAKDDLEIVVSLMSLKSCATTDSIVTNSNV